MPQPVNISVAASALILSATASRLRCSQRARRAARPDGAEVPDALTRCRLRPTIPKRASKRSPSI
eukprot:1250375-Pleurochrysis_carterae.AAC.1